MTRRIAVIAHPPNAAWQGPLLAFLENRARELRDASAVRRARVVQYDPPALTLVIDFAHEYGAADLVRDLVADLEALNAAPKTAAEPGAAA
jgi:hypothetical protein